MSELEIRADQFPAVRDVEMGELVTLTITGFVRKIEDDLVDVAGIGTGPRYMPGATTVTIMPTSVVRSVNP